MAKQRQVELQFPLSGLDRSRAVQKQPPYASADCNNVRPFDTIQGRARGGSRPGLGRHAYELLGSGAKVNMLGAVTYVATDGKDQWADEFQGASMGDMWAAIGTIPPIFEDYASATYNTTVGAVRDALTFNTTVAHYVEAFLVPWDGAWHGSYIIYFGGNDTTPVFTTNGYVCELIMTGTTGAYSGTLKKYVTSTPTTIATFSGTLSRVEAGWLSILITPGGTPTANVFWHGSSISGGAQNLATFSGNRFGVGLSCTVADGYCLMDAFQVLFYNSGTSVARRTELVAAANGVLYRELWPGKLTALSTTLTLASDRLVQCREMDQKLYIADWGTPRIIGTAPNGDISGATLDDSDVSDWTTYGIDVQDDVVVISGVGGATVAGTYKIQSVAAGAVTLTASPGDGTCAYRIERGPKIFDPLASTLALWTATAAKGQVPTGQPTIARYKGRMILAGGAVAPQVWYGSRNLNPLDWLYGESDAQTAIGGPSSEVGTIGEPITALIVHTGEYLVFGCPNSLWHLSGDPAYGAQLQQSGKNVGCIDAGAWCHGPNGELYVLSHQGLYSMAPGGMSDPVPVSERLVPRELLHLDPNTHTILLAYDVQNRGVHLYVTPDEAKTSKHWWYDITTKSLWPVTLSANFEPFSILTHNTETAEGSVTLLGTRNGYVRRYRNEFETDEGTEIVSYVLFGPLAPGGLSGSGYIMELQCILGDQSGDVDWAVRHADSAHEAVAAANFAEGTFTLEGANYTVSPRSGGPYQCVKLSNGEATRRWAVESLAAVLMDGGRFRKL